MPWLEDIQDWVAGESLGLVTGTSLFLGDMPDGDDVAEPTVSLSFLPGQVMHAMGATGPAVRAPMFQIMSRAHSYAAALEAIEGVYNALGLIKDQQIGTTKFLMVAADSEIEDQHKDGRDRQMFVARFRAWR